MTNSNSEIKDTKNNFRDDYLELIKFLSPISEDIASTFNTKQLKALESAVSHHRRRKKRQLNISLILPFIKRRYYIAVHFGEERRSLTRGELRAASVLTLALSSILILSLISFAAIAIYFFKSIAGIDLFPEFSLSFFPTIFR